MAVRKAGGHKLTAKGWVLDTPGEPPGAGRVEPAAEPEPESERKVARKRTRKADSEASADT